MKNTSYLVSYIFMLIIGVLLLVFANQTNIFEIMIVVIGICLIIPSIVSLFMGFSGKRQPDGTRQSRPWYVATTAIAGLIGGVLLVAMPGFFVKYLIYTLAIILIVAGIAQIIFISSQGRDIGGMATAWYIMPWLTVIGGVVILIIGPDRIAQWVTIITGILLALYGINGLLSAASHRSVVRRLRRYQVEQSRKAEEDEKNAAKAAKEAEKAEKAAEVAEEKEKEVKGENPSKTSSEISDKSQREEEEKKE